MPGGVPRKHARTSTDEGHQSHQGPSSILSWTVGSSFHRIEHQNQTMADAGSEHFAVCSRSSCVASERRGNAGRVAKQCTTTHCKIPCSCVSRAHARPSKEAWSTHSIINAASSEVALGKEMAARRNIPRGGADRCRRSHESDGVWTTVVHRRRDSPVSSWKTWMPFEDSCGWQKRETEKSRMPEPLQAYWETIFHVGHPQETRCGGSGWLRHLRRISAGCFRMLRELTSGQGYRVKSSHAIARGERCLKIHLQQWCGQSAHDAQTASRLEAKTETQGFERVKK